MRNKLFTKYILFAVVSFTLVIAIMNYFIDPYGKNNRYTTDLNRLKIIRDERISKFDLLLTAPDASSFIFGSSRGLILDPEVLEKNTGEKSLNLAFSSATAEEYYLYIKYLFETREVKNIIIGIDLFAYAEGFESTGTLPQTLRNYFEMDDQYPVFKYISLKMFKRTIKTIKYNLGHNEEDIDDKYTEKGKVIVHDYIQALKNQDAFTSYIDKNVVNKPARWAARYDVLDQGRLDHLNKIKLLCLQNDAKLYLFTSPLFIKQVLMKQNKFFLQKELLRYIVSNISPVLDLNNLLSLNLEPSFYIDEFHYSYKVADSILFQLLTGKPTQQEYKGEFVNKSNIDQYLRKIDSRLEMISSGLDVQSAD